MNMLDDKKKTLVYLGSDHAGFKAKEELKDHLQNNGGFSVTDLGCFSEDQCDYPDIAREVGEKVQEHQDAFGVLICGSGVGVAIAANKVKGIRAAQVNNEFLAEGSRKHNDANVITMGSRDIDTEKMKKVLDIFLSTKFESGEERHVRRVGKINAMDGIS